MMINKAKEDAPRFSGPESPLSSMLRALPDLQKFTRDMRDNQNYRNGRKKILNHRLSQITIINLNAINLCNVTKLLKEDTSSGRLQKSLDLTDSIHVKLQEMISNTAIICHRIQKKIRSCVVFCIMVRQDMNW